MDTNTNATMFSKYLNQSHKLIELPDIKLEPNKLEHHAKLFNE
jgi:hypothetical protein